MIHVQSKTCGCGQRILLVPHEVSGKRIAIDNAPNERGNVIVYQDKSGRWVAHVLRKDTTPPMMPHPATCKLMVAR